MNTRGESSFEELKTAQDYRDEIRLLYKEKKCLDGYKLNKEFVEKLENKYINHTKNDLWAAYVNLSIGSLMLGTSVDNIGKYAKKSLLYATIGKEVIDSKNMLALYYKKNGKIEKASEMYGGCIEQCNVLLKNQDLSNFDSEVINDILISKATHLNNKGRVDNNEILIYKAIKTYKKVTYNNNLRNEIIIKKLDSCYYNIFNLYFNRNLTKEAEQILSKIQDISIKEELRNKMLNKTEKVVGIL